MSSLDSRRQSLPDLRRRLNLAFDEANWAVNDAQRYKEAHAKVEALTAQIEGLQANRRSLTGSARPAPGDNSKFADFGEFLRSVAHAYSGGGADRRLVRAPFGAGESDPSAGGFLVDTEFANTVMTRMYDLGEIIGRVFRLPISVGNGIKIPAVNETSRATGSRWGGVQAYWVGEGDAATATKPGFRLIELDLKKLMGLWYVTDELMADAPALATVANEAFAEELLFLTEASFIQGTGAGQPLGILNSPALVTVAKDNGQATKTLSYNNILTMWSRMWNRSRKNAVWLINQDVEPQLYALSQTIGVGGVPVFLPANGISGAPYATLMGRPVLASEYCNTLGTPGDIILADFSQYVMAEKASMQAASSMHVRFTTDEMTFRLTWRVDGEPLWNAPLTPFEGSSTRSPYVVLAQR